MLVIYSSLGSRCSSARMTAMTRSDWTRLAGRILAAIVVIGGLYAVYAVPSYIKHHRKPASHNLSQLRAELQETNITLNDAIRLQAGNPAADQQLADISSHLHTLTMHFQNTLAHPPKDVPTDVQTSLKNITNLQDTLVKQFDARHNVLSKVIQYNPSDDLGKLTYGPDNAKLSARATAAASALKALASKDGFSLDGQPHNALDSVNSTSYLVLSDEFKAALLASSSCFDSVNQAVAANHKTEAEQALQSCENSYPNVRQLAVETVIEPLKSDQAKALTQSIQQLTNQLARR